MAAVNYIVEHEAFIEYAQDNGLSAAEQLLWYALAHIFNRRAQGGSWPDGFIRVTNKTVLSLLPFTEDSMAAARNRLKQRGLIDYIPGRKNAEIPMYKMVYFSVPAARDDDEGDVYPKISGKPSGKPQGNDRGNAADIYTKQNEDVNGFDDDDVEDDDAPRAQREADRSSALRDAWAEHFGGSPLPGEAARILRASETLCMTPAMVAEAVSRAAFNRARSPAAYIIDLLKNWRDGEIMTPAELEKEEYLRRYGGRTAEDTLRDREERRRAHREGEAWP